jgi:hypothetical protein
MGGTELDGQSDYVSHVGGDYDAGESSQNIGDPDSGEADGDEEESEMQNLMKRKTRMDWRRILIPRTQMKKMVKRTTRRYRFLHHGIIASRPA